VCWRVVGGIDKFGVKCKNKLWVSIGTVTNDSAGTCRGSHGGQGRFKIHCSLHIVSYVQSAL
jgi:hypothetical protein